MGCRLGWHAFVNVDFIVLSRLRRRNRDGGSLQVRSEGIERSVSLNYQRAKGHVEARGVIVEGGKVG